MPQSHTETLLSPRSSLSSSPFSSASSIDSPLISDSISDWVHNNSQDADHTRTSNYRRRHYHNGVLSPASSCNCQSSDSDSSPMTPWNLRSDLALPETSDRRQDICDEDHLNLDMDHDRDENDVPPLYLGHTRWKQAQGIHTPGQTPSKHLSGDRTNVHGPDRAVVHRKSRSKLKSRQNTHRNVYYERHLSARVWKSNISSDPQPFRLTARDFFLILTLCFVLACFLICLARPVTISLFASPVSLLGLDEL